MSIFLDEIKELVLYKKILHLPINEDRKKKNSVIFLMTPNIDSSMNLLKNKFTINLRTYESYYIEKDITYIINQENALLENNNIVTGCNIDYVFGDDVKITESSIRSKNRITFFNEAYETINESNPYYNNTLKKLLYKDRIKNNKECFLLYDRVKNEHKWIKKTYIDYKHYDEKNLFVDWAYYTEAFFKNNTFKMDKGLNLFFEYMSRFLNDSRLAQYNYTNKAIFIPVMDWIDRNDEITFWDYKKYINPITILYRMIKKNPVALKETWGGVPIVFFGDNGYFKLDLGNFTDKDLNKLTVLLRMMIKNSPVEDVDSFVDSPKAIVATIVNKIETNGNIEIHNLTGKSSTISKEELGDKVLNSIKSSDPTLSDPTLDEKKTQLVNNIIDGAKKSNDVDSTLDTLEDDGFTKKLMLDVISDEDNTVKVNATRLARSNKLQQEFLDKKFNNTPIKKLLSDEKLKSDKELEPTKIPIKSINPEWQEMRFMNFEKEYDINADIISILTHFSTTSMKVTPTSFNVQDNSTSEDIVDLWEVKFEDINGQRFTLKFDVPKPKGKNDRFLRLRGNDKIFSGQLANLPIIKTDEDTVQVVSNYNKIFIRRYGTNTGKSCTFTDILVKALDKYEGKDIKVSYGDNSRICSKYELPIDYIDLASVYNKIEVGDTTIYFNQDELRKNYKITESNGLPYGVLSNKSVLYAYKSEFLISSVILNILKSKSPEFEKVVDSVNLSSKHTYSKASILNTEIPLVVVMGYCEGLQSVLKKAKINHGIYDKKPTWLNKLSTGLVKFKDGYISYDILDLNASLLMNGLKECDTENYSIKDMNSKSMWVDFLDLFGGRIKADGLDNFYDLMVDPITKEVCEYYNLPTDFIEMLAYANILLSDNKYNKHTDLTGNRYRTNEIIAGYTYKCLAQSYGEYKNASKRTRNATMTIKQSAIIDAILVTEPTTTDASKLNPILEYESASAVSFKGLSGMNSDRSYGMNKRTFDDSMLNVLAMSTGFAANVGITRQCTIDMNVQGTRGYIKTTKNPDNLTTTKTLSMTEALTPFGTTRDDPFRTAMTFIQTSRHSMRVKCSSPSLIVNGAEEALPYMTSDTFAHKAKFDGKIIEKTDDYMVVDYGDNYPGREFIDLRENVEKNSDGGFYITLKLDSDLKKGDKVKANDILAYDKNSYSDITSHTGNIAYNLGTLAKVAILITDDGFEDSAIITDWLSEAMTSEVLSQKTVELPKNTNVYYIAKKGEPIQEGEPFIIFQNAFNENDMNILLKNITDDEDEISDLGRIPVKSKNTGMIQDVLVYRTVDKTELSGSLKKIVNDYDKDISKMKSVMGKNKIKDLYKLKPDYKLEPIGKLKNCKDGVMIEFYTKYSDKMGIGDKLVYYSALKGVVKDIYPKGLEPTSEFRPNEQIHSLVSVSSINARMVGSIQIVAGINKVLIELDRKVKEIMGVKWKPLEDILLKK